MSRDGRTGEGTEALCREFENTDRRAREEIPFDAFERTDHPAHHRPVQDTLERPNTLGLLVDRDNQALQCCHCGVLPPARLAKRAHMVTTPAPLSAQRLTHFLLGTREFSRSSLHRSPSSVHIGPVCGTAFHHAERIDLSDITPNGRISKSAQLLVMPNEGCL